MLSKCALVVFAVLSLSSCSISADSLFSSFMFVFLTRLWLLFVFYIFVLQPFKAEVGSVPVALPVELPTDCFTGNKTFYKPFADRQFVNYFCKRLMLK